MATPSLANLCGSGRQRQTLARVYLSLGLVALLLLPGCGGCAKDPAEAEKDLEKKLTEQRNKPKPKPDFDEPRLVTQPSGVRLTERKESADEGRASADKGQEVLSRAYKPGHWTGVGLATKANNFDFLGDLEIVVTNRRGEPVPLPSARFDLTTAREIALPKRQWKVFESLLFVPPASHEVLAGCRLIARKGGARPWEVSHLLAPMPSYQYHFVVLARLPERYTYLKTLVSFKPPSDEFASERSEPYYRTALLRDDLQAPLPAHALQWTSIACVLWDDAAPAALSIEQQRALLDWLHWGGQLIVSGPDTLDALRGSFLAPYLPATGGKARQLRAEDFEPLGRWSNQAQPLVPVATWTGVPLQKHAEARFLPGSGELLVERRVGRGRVIVSAFRLSGRELTSWPGLDELLNAFLLRRPARRFTNDENSGPQVHWADDVADRHRLDAARVSNVRYFTRDTGVTMETYATDIGAADVDLGEGAPTGPGVGAWNNSNPLANEARLALKHAAQIEIPDRQFVVWVLVGYLLVLVPVNWGVFRVIGRVEWAWAAAPVIAVACTAAVIRLAQLDIGFARSRTEIAMVEVQGGYARAHVTRYAALYTALTTRYRVRFDDPGGLVQPFPRVIGPGQAADHRRLLYHRGSGAELSDVFVESNSTGMIHSEQMLDLGGTIALGTTAADEDQVTNHTRLTVLDAGVLRRDPSGGLEAAWLGTLEPGAAVSLGFRRLAAASGSQPWNAERKEPILTGSGLGPGELNLSELVRQAQSVGDLAAGDVRLVGLLEAGSAVQELLAGMEITPTAPQSQQAALVVAHLRYGNGPDPQPDKNSLRDVAKPVAGKEAVPNPQSQSRIPRP